MKLLSASAPHHQRGVSKLGLITLLLLLTVFFTLGLKVGPMYVDHNLITGICQELIDNGEAASMNTQDIRNRVASSLRINNVRGFELSAISKRMENDAPIITINYERRVELIGNLDVVARFDSVLQ